MICGQKRTAVFRGGKRPSGVWSALERRGGVIERHQAAVAHAGVAVADLEVAVVDLEHERAEAGAVDVGAAAGCGGGGSGDFATAFDLVAAVFELVGEDFRAELIVPFFPWFAALLEEGLSVIVPCVEVAVGVPAEGFLFDGIDEEADALADFAGVAVAERLEAEEGGAAEVPLIVVAFAARVAEAAVGGLHAFEVFLDLFVGTDEAGDFEVGVFGGFEGLELPTGDGEVIAAVGVVADAVFVAP